MNKYTIGLESKSLEGKRKVNVLVVNADNETDAERRAEIWAENHGHTFPISVKIINVMEKFSFA